MAGTESVTSSLNILVAGTAPAPGMPVLPLRLQDWQSPDFDLAAFDARVERLAAEAGERPCAVCLSGGRDANSGAAGAKGANGSTAATGFDRADGSDSSRGSDGSDPADASAGALAAAALQIALRCQRLRARRNAASSCDTFDRTLSAHHEMYRPRRGGAGAAYAHALDSWQWLLRLDPEAGLTAQIAALFHGAAHPEPAGAAAHPVLAGHPAHLARSAQAGTTEPTEPTEPTKDTASGAEKAADANTALRGAWLVDDLLAEHEIDVATRVGVHRLLAGHGPACDLGRLAAARALSRLSLATAQSLPAQEAVQALLAQLDPACRRLVAALRLPAALAALTALTPSIEVTATDAASLAGTAAAQAGTAAAQTGTVASPAAQSPAEDTGVATSGWRTAKSGPAAGAAAATAPCRKPGRRYTTAAALTRARMSAGLLGAAGFARTRTSALLARAAAVGALAVTPPTLPLAAAGSPAGRTRIVVPLPARDQAR